METPPKLRPAAKKHVVPCPKCGQGWPVVQALWEHHGKRMVLINCCSHCGIIGEVERN